MSLQALFNPRGVALCGSTSPGKIGYELLRNMVEGGYADVVAINPKAQGALGVPGFASVAEVGRPVDLAIVAAPAAAVTGVLEDCGRAGVRAAVVITAGFSEVGNHAAEDEVRQVAARHGIRFVGPNCAGIVNTRHALYPTLETRPPAGDVAFISQSGALGGAVLAWAEQQGVGFSKFVSYGNAADLNEIDFLDYLLEDDETKVVALYIEAVSDGQGFVEAARALTAHKPLVVIKSGRTRSGQRATLSHTGSMAGSDDVYDAAIRAAGAIRAHTIEEMFDLCKGFVSLPPVRGRRVAIVTNSGGPGVLAADRAEEVGLDVAAPSAALRAELQAFLPSYCAFENPFDMTVEGDEAGYRRTLAAVLAEYDAALALDVCTPYLDSLSHARGVVDAAQASGKPVAANFMADKTVAAALPYLKAHGVPNFATGERAVAVLAQMARYEAARVERRPLPQPVPQTRALPGEGMLLEPEAMALLRENGIPVPEFRFVSTVEAAVAGCAALGYPVAMKVVSPDILHKSDAGGVVLGIRDDAQAEAAFERIEAAAAGYDFRGVVIYPMVRAAQEVLLGLSRDPQFGPVVVFGLGGIYTEVWRDVALRLAPVDRQGAEEMIRAIRGYPILTGIRGQAAGDLDALADALVNVSQLPFRYPEIAEVDLNPVFV
ncbi:MAG: acetate--CoA ligase family protein, partial [Anaerolineae bacterium]|nr:acetate--CoA ligase family protein [Anaerolineae bacterium]